jgi:hypothetical protein
MLFEEDFNVSSEDVTAENFNTPSENDFINGRY